MKNKKVSLANFTSEGRQYVRKAITKDKFNSHSKKMNKIKEVSNGCWWLELYLKDSCNLVKREGIK